MKPSRISRAFRRTDRFVAWWSTLLLVALGAVLTALYLSLRLVLSVANEQGSHSGADAALPRAEHVSPLRDMLSTPNRSELIDRD